MFLVSLYFRETPACETDPEATELMPSEAKPIGGKEHRQTLRIPGDGSAVPKTMFDAHVQQ